MTVVGHYDPSISHNSGSVWDYAYSDHWGTSPYDTYLPETDPGDPFGLGDLGEPHTPTPKRTPLENKLNDCTQSLFGVGLISFNPSRRGQNGSFIGYGADKLSSGGLNSEIMVINEVNSYSKADIKRITGQDWFGVAFSPDSSNEARGFTPYRNFTANDLKNSRAILATQIHELGNSLQYITGVTMSPNPKPGIGGDTDAGTRLERCVFGGEYDAKGNLQKF